MLTGEVDTDPALHGGEHFDARSTRQDALDQVEGDEVVLDQQDPKHAGDRSGGGRRRPGGRRLAQRDRAQAGGGARRGDGLNRRRWEVDEERAAHIRDRDKVEPTPHPGDQVA